MTDQVWSWNCEKVARWVQKFLHHQCHQSKKNGPCIGCGWRKGAPVKQIWIPFQCSQFLKMRQVASLANFHDRWLSSAKSMVLSDSQTPFLPGFGLMFRWFHGVCTDFRQSAKSAPYTAGEAAYKQAEDAGLSKEEQRRAFYQRLNRFAKHQGSGSISRWWCCQEQCAKAYSAAWKTAKAPKNNQSKNDKRHNLKVHIFFTCSRSAGHTRYLFGSSVYHQAGGKIGEQVTDAAAGVMVKLAPKIGLSTRDLVYCSTEAAKVLWRDWWDFCQDTVDLKRICWYFVGKWICNLKMDFLRNSMLREVFEFYW